MPVGPPSPDRAGTLAAVFEQAIPLGLVWEAGDADGAAVWAPGGGPHVWFMRSG